MARYLVTVHRSPGRVQIGGHRYEATDLTDALRKGYHSAGNIIHHRRIAKYRCSYMVWNVSRDDGIPVLLFFANYQSPGKRAGVDRGERSWLSGQ